MGRGRYRPNKPLPFRMRLWIKQRYRCPICKRQIRGRELFKDWINLDHIIAKSKGGTRDPDNMAVVHIWCNQAKADSCPCDFYGPEFCTTDIHSGDGEKRRGAVLSQAEGEIMAIHEEANEG